MIDSTQGGTTPPTEMRSEEIEEGSSWEDYFDEMNGLLSGNRGIKGTFFRGDEVRDLTAELAALPMDDDFPELEYAPPYLSYESRCKLSPFGPYDFSVPYDDSILGFSVTRPGSDCTALSDTIPRGGWVHNLSLKSFVLYLAKPLFRNFLATEDLVNGADFVWFTYNAVGPLICYVNLESMEGVVEVLATFTTEPESADRSQWTKSGGRVKLSPFAKHILAEGGFITVTYVQGNIISPLMIDFGTILSVAHDDSAFVKGKSGGVTVTGKESVGFEKADFVAYEVLKTNKQQLDLLSDKQLSSFRQYCTDLHPKQNNASNKIKELWNFVRAVSGTGGNFDFLDLCAGPGHFSQFLRTVTAGTGVGLTLNSHETGSAFMPELVSDPDYQVIYGDINTTDAFNAIQAVELPNFNKALYGADLYPPLPKFAVIVADGAVPSGDHGDQEQVNCQLIVREVLYALQFIKWGGTFVVKVFGVNTSVMLNVLGVLLCCFEGVHAIKPPSSRSTNSEFYFVCIGARPPETFDKIEDLTLCHFASEAPADQVYVDMQLFQRWLNVRQSIALEAAFQKLEFFPALVRTVDKRDRNLPTRGGRCCPKCGLFCPHGNLGLFFEKCRSCGTNYCLHCDLVLDPERMKKHGDAANHKICGHGCPFYKPHNPCASESVDFSVDVNKHGVLISYDPRGALVNCDND